MNRENEELVELGAVSSDTKGGEFIVEDSDQSRSLPLGLTDD
jgi:hypothetical protein